MSGDWRDLSEKWERLRWARQNAGHKTGTDAAAALNIEAATYRTYERAPEDGGRWPKSVTVQHMGRKFKVDWVWIETGSGAPLTGPDAEADAANKELADRVVRLPVGKRADAVSAAISVLDSYIKRGA